MASSDTGASRRDFIKTVAIAAGTAGALGACGKAATSPSDGPVGSPTEQPAGLPITVAGYRCDRVEALIDGRVPIEGCDVTFEESRIGDLNTHVISGPQTIEVAEVGLHPYMLAFANDGFPGLQPDPGLPAASLPSQERVHSDRPWHRGSRGSARQSDRHPPLLLDLPHLAPGHLPARIRDHTSRCRVGSSLKGFRRPKRKDLETGASAPAGRPHPPRSCGSGRIRAAGVRRGGRPVPRRRAKGLPGRQSDRRPSISRLPPDRAGLLREDRHLSDYACGCGSRRCHP